MPPRRLEFGVDALGAGLQGEEEVELAHEINHGRMQKHQFSLLHLGNQLCRETPPEFGLEGLGLASHVIAHSDRRIQNSKNLVAFCNIHYFFQYSGLLLTNKTR